MSTETKTKFKEMEEKLNVLKRVAVLPKAQVNFRTERYIGAPEPGIAPYERILYRYSIQAVAQHANFNEIPHQLQTVPVENRTARFGRDKVFDTMDFIQEVLESDVNTTWRDRVCKCPSCKTWLLADREVAVDQPEVTCYDCIHKSFNEINEVYRKATLEEKMAIHKSFGEEKSKLLGIPCDYLLEYMMVNSSGKGYIDRIKPAQIDRFTVELGNEEVVWPDWWNKAPETFRAFCLECGATPAILYAGQLDQATFKKVRTEWHEKQGNKFLPASPRIAGLLTAFSADDAVIKEFEKRGGHAVVKASELVKGVDKIYLSNEGAPLFNIGVWGVNYYSSCQNWRSAGNGGHCRTLSNLEDPNVMVMWCGTPNVMKARALIRKVKIKSTDELALGIDVWYGGRDRLKEMLTKLKAWGKKNGYNKVAFIRGHHIGDAKYNAESIEPIKFSNNSPSYTDLGAWQQVDGKAGMWTYKVHFTGDGVDW